MEVLGDGVCLIGGVSPIVLCHGTPDDVRRQVLDLFDRLPTRRNLLLCTSDATAYGTPLANLRAVADTFSAGADSLPRVSDFSPQTSLSRVRASECMAANV